MQPTRAFWITLLVSVVAIGGTLTQILANSPATAGASSRENAASEAELPLTRIREIAQHEADQAGDSHPVTILSARGTFAAAQAVLDGDAPAAQNSAGGNAAAVQWAQDPVYLVIMRGEFSLMDARVPPGGRNPTGPVMGMIVNVQTGFCEGRYVGPSVPDLEALGPVTELTANSG